MFFVRLVEPVQLYHTTVPGTATATLVCMLYTCTYTHVYVRYNVAHAHAAGVHALTFGELLHQARI